MNFTRTRLTTRLRTWTLVAGLTAILIAIGALIGGMFMWVFAAVAVGTNLVGYFYSDRIALRAVRGQPLTEAQAPEVHAAVRELAQPRRDSDAAPVPDAGRAAQRFRHWA